MLISRFFLRTTQFLKKVVFKFHNLFWQSKVVFNFYFVWITTRVNTFRGRLPFHFILLTMVYFYYNSICIEDLLHRDRSVLIFFILFVHCSWLTHFVRFFFSRLKNWFRLFSKLSSISHLFCSFSYWTNFQLV